MKILLSESHVKRQNRVPERPSVQESSSSKRNKRNGRHQICLHTRDSKECVRTLQFWVWSKVKVGHTLVKVGGCVFYTNE